MQVIPHVPIVGLFFVEVVAGLVLVEERIEQRPVEAFGADKCGIACSHKVQKPIQFHAVQPQGTSAEKVTRRSVHLHGVHHVVDRIAYGHQVILFVVFEHFVEHFAAVGLCALGVVALTPRILVGVVLQHEGQGYQEPHKRHCGNDDKYLASAHRFWICLRKSSNEGLMRRYTCWSMSVSPYQITSKR